MTRKKTRKKPARIPDQQWVYIMSNDSMPGLLKIGMTTTSPQQRNRELGSATGVPTPFRLEYSIEVSNARQVEQVIHRELSAYRVNRRREFFEMDLKLAIRTLRGVANQRGLPLNLPGRVLSLTLELIMALILFWLLTSLWTGI